MQGTDVLEAKVLLKNLLDECRKCTASFIDNVALIVDAGEVISEEQAGEALVILSEEHKKH